MSAHDAVPKLGRSDPTGRYKGSNYNPNYRGKNPHSRGGSHRGHHQDHHRPARDIASEEGFYSHDNGRDWHSIGPNPSVSSGSIGGYDHNVIGNGNGNGQVDEWRYAMPPTNVNDAIAAISALPTPTPTINTQSGSAAPTSPNMTGLQAQETREQALDSLAKLRQFKAEVEASRHTKGSVAELDPSRLAQMAESFLLSQSHGTLSSVQQDEDQEDSKQILSFDEQQKLAREQQLKDQLKSRLRGSEAGYSTKRDRLEADYETYEDNMPKCPRPELELETRSVALSGAENPPSRPVATRDDRYDRRDSDRRSDRETPPSAPQQGRMNFVPARFQKDFTPGSRGILEPADARRESQDYAREAREPSGYHNRDGNNDQQEGRSLAERIGGTAARPKRRSRSPNKQVATYRPMKAVSPARGPSREPYGRPPSPGYYPDPRTPPLARHAPYPYDIAPAPPAARYDGRDDDYRRYDRDRQGYLPPPPERPSIPEPSYARRGPPSPYADARSHEYRPVRDYPPEYRADPYSRSEVVSHRRSIDDYDRRAPPAPPPPAAIGLGLDTNNVVETLEALKAQISKLEKLVPVAAAASASAPPAGPRDYPRDSYASASSSSTYARGSGYDAPLGFRRGEEYPSPLGARRDIAPSEPSRNRNDYAYGHPPSPNPPIRRDAPPPRSPMDRRGQNANVGSGARPAHGGRGSRRGHAHAHGHSGERGRGRGGGRGGHGGRGRGGGNDRH